MVPPLPVEDLLLLLLMVHKNAWSGLYYLLFFVHVVMFYMFLSGMAFGTGSAIAHRAVDAVLGPRTIQHETVVSAAPSTVAVAASPVSSTVGSDACTIQSKAFQDVCVLP